VSAPSSRVKQSKNSRGYDVRLEQSLVQQQLLAPVDKSNVQKRDRNCTCESFA